MLRFRAALFFRIIALAGILVPAWAADAQVVIHKGINSKLCQAMLNGKHVRVPAEAQLLFQSRHRALDDVPPFHVGMLSKEHVDFDNDGEKEVVYSFHSSGRSETADRFFIAPASEVENKWPNVSYRALWEATTYVFPNSETVCLNKRCQYEDDIAFPLKTFTQQGRSFRYRIRYLQALAFRFNGATFLLLSSAEPDNRISALVRPKKDLTSHTGRRVEELCVFRRTGSP